MPDHTDALAAVERRVEAPDEVPQLLVELADGAMAGLGLSRGEVCRIHANPKCRAGAAVGTSDLSSWASSQSAPSKPSRRTAGSAARVLVTVQLAAGQLQGVDDEKVCRTADVRLRAQGRSLRPVTSFRGSGRALSSTDKDCAGLVAFGPAIPPGYQPRRDGVI
jgi:hypothetical protein